MVGELRPRAQPVVGVDADPPVHREVVQQRDALLALVADDPAAAVDLQDAGPQVARLRVGRLVDVEADLLLAVLRERDVAERG